MSKNRYKYVRSSGYGPSGVPINLRFEEYEPENEITDTEHHYSGETFEKNNAIPEVKGGNPGFKVSVNKLKKCKGTTAKGTGCKKSACGAGKYCVYHRPKWLNVNGIKCSRCLSVPTQH